MEWNELVGKRLDNQASLLQHSCIAEFLSNAAKYSLNACHKFLEAVQMSDSKKLFIFFQEWRKKPSPLCSQCTKEETRDVQCFFICMFLIPALTKTVAKYAEYVSKDVMKIQEMMGTTQRNTLIET